MQLQRALVALANVEDAGVMMVNGRQQRCVGTKQPAHG